MLFQQVWSHNLHQGSGFHTTVFSPPLILTTERTNRLIRLDPETGSPLWEAKVRNPWGRLSATGTQAFYLNQHTLLQCFDLRQGEAAWQRDRCIGPFVVSEDRLAIFEGVGHRQRDIQCFDTVSGTRLWRHIRDYTCPKLLSGPWGIALPDTKTRELTIIAWENGRVVRRLPLPDGLWFQSWSISIQRYGDDLIVTTKDGQIYLLDPAIDETWRQVGIYDEEIWTIMPAILGYNLIFQDREQRLCYYDVNRGNVRWARRIVPPHIEHYGHRVAATGISGERIVVGTSIGRLEVLNLEGDRIGAHTVGKRVATDLCAVGNDEVIFGTTGLIVRYSIQ